MRVGGRHSNPRHSPERGQRMAKGINSCGRLEVASLYPRWGTVVVVSVSAALVDMQVAVRMGEMGKIWLPLPISREIGCGSQRPGKFPGKFRGCAANSPGNSPGNCAAADFPGNWMRSRGMSLGISREISRLLDFPGNFPGTWMRIRDIPREIGARRAGFETHPIGKLGRPRR